LSHPNTKYIIIIINNERFFHNNYPNELMVLILYIQHKTMHNTLEVTTLAETNVYLFLAYDKILTRQLYISETKLIYALNWR